MITLLGRCFRSRAGQFRVIHVRSSSSHPSVQNLKGFKELRDKFKDSTSPFYLAPGERGPESPDPTPSPVPEKQSYESAAAWAKHELVQMGYHPDTFYEQRVVWGDLDSFQCVLSVRFLGK